MAMPAPVARIRRNSSTMTPPRGLLLRIHGANRHAVRVLHHLDEELLVVVAVVFHPADARRVPRVRLNLPVSVDYFQRLPGLQVPLPVKIALRKDRPLFLGWCRPAQP